MGYCSLEARLFGLEVELRFGLAKLFSDRYRTGFRFEVRV